MKKYAFLLFVNVLLLNFNSFGKNVPSYETGGKYAVSNIPEELMEDAYAVVRMDYSLFELKSPKHAKLTRKYAITILNHQADSYAHFRQYYNDQNKIASIKGIIYDKNGKEIRKLKKKDVVDMSAVSNISLIEDTRVKYIEALHNEYPFTIEFEYEEKFMGLVSYPRWVPVLGYKISVEQSVYKAIIPKKMGMRYKVKNFDSEPQVTSQGENKIYKWEMENHSAVDDEPYSPNARNFLPIVFLSPNDFEYDGSKGNMSTWESYGKWLYDLAEGRDDLPQETIIEIKKLVQGVESKEEQVRIIYEYLQSKTRYISIQLGIGGWQPFKASDVDKNGYGDCKALSNYTYAMLKAVGIKSYNATIGAGRGHTSIEPDFPSMGFTNHQILCVPLENDTIWLECTSQDNPFGFIGNFTDDRKALIATEEGGKVVHTTRYLEADNTQKRTATVDINTSGMARAHLVTKYRGLQYDNVSRQFVNNEKEQKEVLFKRLDIPNMEIDKFEYTQIKDRIPEATETLDLQIKNYASVSGKRIFVPLNILNKKRRTPPKVKNRKTDVVIGMAYIDVDEITYQISGAYEVEHLPKSVSFESDFGTYSAEVTQDGNKVTYVRTMTLHKNTYPAARYEDLQKFYKKIVKADKMKVVMVKNERP